MNKLILGLAFLALAGLGQYTTLKLQEIVELKQDLDKLKNIILGLESRFGDEQSRPGPVEETEYLLLPQEEKVAATVVAVAAIPARTIDPNKIPVTKNWVLHGGETVETLSAHLTDPNDPHKVQGYLIKGWNLQQLRRLHSYLHNGFPLEALYE